MNAFQEENIVYSAVAAENGVGGRVVVNVERDGSISGVQLKQGVTHRLTGRLCV